MIKNSSLAKTIRITFILILAALVFASCVYDAVHYCPFCGKSGIEEVSTYNKDTGLTEIYYKCTNAGCGKSFGAGMAP